MTSTFGRFAHPFLLDRLATFSIMLFSEQFTEKAKWLLLRFLMFILKRASFRSWLCFSRSNRWPTVTCWQLIVGPFHSFLDEFCPSSSALLFRLLINCTYRSMWECHLNTDACLPFSPLIFFYSLTLRFCIIFRVIYVLLLTSGSIYFTVRFFRWLACLVVF